MPDRLRTHRPTLGSRRSPIGFAGTAKRPPPTTGAGSLDRQIEALAGESGPSLGREDTEESFGERMSQLVVKPTIQAKSYDLSTPGDPAEREADHVADQVMRRLGGETEQSVDPIRASPTAPILPDREGSSMGATPDSFASTLDSSSGGGRPLPSGLRRRVEGVMGESFAKVRVHSDPKANELSSSIQARAFTKGPNIYFGRGEYRPESPGGQRLLAHELTHVAQQAKSPDKGTIHRKLTVGGTVYKGWRIRGNSSKQVRQAWAKIKASKHTPATKWGNAHLNRLQLWVSREASYSVQVWMSMQDLEFSSWEEAAQALDAEVEAQANRQREKRLAKTAKGSNPAIKTNLAAAMRKIGAWVTQAYPGQVAVRARRARTDTLYPSIWHWLEVFHGQYDHFYPNGHIKTRMNRPTPKKVSTNFAILREIVYALGSVTGVGYTDTDTATSIYDAPSPYDGGARYGTSSTGRTRIDKDGGETRDGWTMVGTHDWVKHARAKKMPLSAGASNTTDRMLQMAGKAGCGARGKQAIAWAGFIFWNTKFYTHHSPSHTFHEIMDIANVNHGVSYDVDNPYGFQEAEQEEVAPRSSVPDFDPLQAIILLDKTAAPAPPTPVVPQQQAPVVDTTAFANIPTGPVLGKPTFADGKTMTASKTMGGTARTVTFMATPSETDENQLPLKMHKVICTPDMRAAGLAQLQPLGFGRRFVFVRLSDLFDLQTGHWNLN